MHFVPVHTISLAMPDEERRDDGIHFEDGFGYLLGHYYVNLVLGTTWHNVCTRR